MGYEQMREEFEMSGNVNYLTGLPFGHGHIGERTQFADPEQQRQFAAALNACVVPLTVTNTADCVDERRTIALGDGTTDPVILQNRIVAQMPGGLVLEATKAATGAGLAIIRDAKDFKAAYLTMYELLTSLGFEDGGHAKCGASALVETSVSDQVEAEMLLRALPVLTTLSNDSPTWMARNNENKRQLLESGYYGSWSASWHEAFLSDKVPHNFSILADDPDDPVTHGHHSSGILLIETPGMGFAKNRFIDETGL